MHSSHQESPDYGVSSYEEVPEHADAYEEESKEEGSELDHSKQEESGTLRDEALLEALSLVSEGTYGMSYHDLLDMTQGNLCMVLMKRRQEGVKIPCVCGNNMSKCPRFGHCRKQKRANCVALPCF
jgi:hypothetical protein